METGRPGVPARRTAAGAEQEVSAAGQAGRWASAYTIEEVPDSSVIVAATVPQVRIAITLVTTTDIAVAVAELSIAVAAAPIEVRIVAKVVGCSEGQRTAAIVREVTGQFRQPFAAGAGCSFDIVRIGLAAFGLRRLRRIGLGCCGPARSRS